MALTRPKLEQLDFRSAKTGTHLLDTYLEAAEHGNRQLNDLLNDLFEEDTGEMRTDIFEFRMNPATFRMQTRRGLYLDPDANWVDMPDGFFFRPRGDWAVGQQYEVHDVVRHLNTLYLVNQTHVAGGTSPDESKMTILLNGSTFYSTGASAPDNANPGTKWWNTTNNTLYIFNGTTWQSYNTSVHTEFVGFSVSAEGNLIVTRADGDVTASDYKQWFFGLSDAEYAIDSNGHLIVRY
jgi:hypothetical protein